MKKFILVCGGRREVLLRDDAPYRGKRKKVLLQTAVETNKILAAVAKLESVYAKEIREIDGLWADSYMDRLWKKLGKRIEESKKDAQKLKKFVIDVQRDADKWLYEKDFDPTDGSYDGDAW